MLLCHWTDGTNGRNRKHSSVWKSLSSSGVTKIDRNVYEIIVQSGYRSAQQWNICTATATVNTTFYEWRVVDVTKMVWNPQHKMAHRIYVISIAFGNFEPQFIYSAIRNARKYQMLLWFSNEITLRERNLNISTWISWELRKFPIFLIIFER